MLCLCEVPLLANEPSLIIGVSSILQPSSVSKIPSLSSSRSASSLTPSPSVSVLEVEF